MKTFKEVKAKIVTEAFGDSEQHPFHRTATKFGFQHNTTHSSVGAKVHVYDHPNGGELHLKTGSGGIHSFTLHHAAGSSSGESDNHMANTMRRNGY
jgi:hypothetical protein